MPARGAVQSGAAQPTADPFARGRVVEGERVCAIPVAPPARPSDGVGFADGIQRWVVDGHFDLAPVIRGYVAAATLERCDGELREVTRHAEEFLVVPPARLSGAQRDELDAAGLPVYESDAGPGPHPTVDRWAAARRIEQRREAAERRAIEGFLAARSGKWLVIDGALGPLAGGPGSDRALGLVKSHETQFLEGADLHAALTLAEGARSSVFERIQAGRTPVYSWYLRLWPWNDRDLLFGLVRLERCPGPATVDDATEVSRWVLGERAPSSAPDARWDRLIYPIHRVEAYLRAHAEGWN